MSDWKSLIVAFVPDAEAPAELGESAFDEITTSALDKAHEAGLIRNFKTDSFDYRLFLDPFMQAYGLPESKTLKRSLYADDGAIEFLPTNDCRHYWKVLADFSTRFQADPSIAAEVVRRWDEESLASWIQLQPHPSENAFLAGKWPDSINLWRLEQTRVPIDGARMIGLWNANMGHGYLPGDYPDAAQALFTNRPSDLLTSAFQTFGYVKIMQDWCIEAEGLGLGIMEITY